MNRWHDLREFRARLRRNEGSLVIFLPVPTRRQRPELLLGAIGLGYSEHAERLDNGFHEMGEYTMSAQVVLDNRRWSMSVVGIQFYAQHALPLVTKKYEEVGPSSEACSPDGRTQ